MEIRSVGKLMTLGMANPLVLTSFHASPKRPKLLLMCVVFLAYVTTRTIATISLEELDERCSRLYLSDYLNGPDEGDPLRMLSDDVEGLIQDCEFVDPTYTLDASSIGDTSLIITVSTYLQKTTEGILGFPANCGEDVPQSICIGQGPFISEDFIPPVFNTTQISISLWFRVNTEENFSTRLSLLTFIGIDEDGHINAFHLYAYPTSILAVYNVLGSSSFPVPILHEIKWSAEVVDNFMPLGSWQHIIVDEKELIHNGNRRSWSMEAEDGSLQHIKNFDVRALFFAGEMNLADPDNFLLNDDGSGGFDMWQAGVYNGLSTCQKLMLHEREFHQVQDLNSALNPEETSWNEFYSWVRWTPGADDRFCRMRFGEQGADVYAEARCQVGFSIYSQRRYCGDAEIPSACGMGMCKPEHQNEEPEEENVDPTESGEDHENEPLPETTEPETIEPPVPEPPVPEPPVQEPPVTEPAAIEEATTVAATTVAATSVAVTTAASVATSAATGVAVSNAGAALAGSGTSQLGNIGGGMGGVGVMSIIDHLQIFNLHAQATGNMSSKFTNMADALKWSNFELQIGVVTQISDSISDVDPPSSTRRQLRNWEEYIQKGKSVATLAWSKGSTKITIMIILFLLTIALHCAILKLWASLPLLKSIPLPTLLVFPRIELLVCSVTYLSVAESVGLLLASKGGAAVCLGCLALVYLLLFTGCACLFLQRVAACTETGLMKYERQNLRGDETGEVTTSRWLHSRHDGHWGDEADLIAMAEEPKRTQHYLNSGFRVIPIAKLLWRLGKSADPNDGGCKMREAHQTPDQQSGNVTGHLLPQKLGTVEMSKVKNARRSSSGQQHGGSIKAENKIAPKHVDSDSPTSGKPLLPMDHLTDQELRKAEEEVKERFGILFEEYKGSSKMTTCFFLIDLTHKFFVAITIGLVAGSGVGRFSASSQASMWVLAGGQLMFACAVSWFQPHVDRYKWVAQVMSVWLETGALTCNALLREDSNESTQDAIFYLEVAAVLVQVLSVWLLTLLKVLSLVAFRRKLKPILKEYEEEKRREQQATTSSESYMEESIPTPSEAQLHRVLPTPDQSVPPPASPKQVEVNKPERKKPLSISSPEWWSGKQWVPGEVWR